MEAAGGIRQTVNDSDTIRASFVSETERDDHSLTLKTLDAFTSGYKETFDMFLKGIKDKKMIEVLEKQYLQLKQKYSSGEKRES